MYTNRHDDRTHTTARLRGYLKSLRESPPGRFPPCVLIYASSCSRTNQRTRVWLVFASRRHISPLDIGQQSITAEFNSASISSISPMIYLSKSIFATILSRVRHALKLSLFIELLRHSMRISLPSVHLATVLYGYKGWGKAEDFVICSADMERRFAIV
jgi:hypothetical protein